MIFGGLNMADEAKKNDIDNPSLTMELFQEFKEHNKRQTITNRIMLGILTFALCVITFISCLFIWYIQQFDFVESIDQTGVYTLVDSEGNVISSDLTPDEIKYLMEVMTDGENENNQNPETEGR
jgi:hypothetical protein